MFKLIVLIFMFPVHLYANHTDSVMIVVHDDIIKELHRKTGTGEVHVHGDHTIHNLLKWHTYLNEHFFRLPHSDSFSKFIRLQHRRIKRNQK